MLIKHPSCDPAGTRTQGPYIKSVLLYQLSYGIIQKRGSPRFEECKNKGKRDSAKL